jgi:hypothetical protein
MLNLKEVSASLRYFRGYVRILHRASDLFVSLLSDENPSLMIELRDFQSFEL